MNSKYTMHNNKLSRDLLDVNKVFHQCLLERIMVKTTSTPSRSQLWVWTPVRLIIIIISSSSDSQSLWSESTSSLITNIHWLSNPLVGTSITTTILRLSNHMDGTSRVTIWSRHSLSTSLTHHNHTCTDPNQHWIKSKTNHKSRIFTPTQRVVGDNSSPETTLDREPGAHRKTIFFGSCLVQYKN